MAIKRSFHTSWAAACRARTPGWTSRARCLRPWTRRRETRCRPAGRPAAAALQGGVPEPRRTPGPEASSFPSPCRKRWRLRLLAVMPPSRRPKTRLKPARSGRPRTQAPQGLRSGGLPPRSRPWRSWRRRSSEPIPRATARRGRRARTWAATVRRRIACLAGRAWSLRQPSRARACPRPPPHERAGRPTRPPGAAAPVSPPGGSGHFCLRPPGPRACFPPCSLHPRPGHLPHLAM